MGPRLADEEKCQKKKLLALGKRDLCLQTERGKEVLGKTPDVAKCAENFDKMIASAEKVEEYRWLDDGDGPRLGAPVGAEDR
ncbi:MAG: hypothetical protein P8R42_15735 [Candidatus Binatia bacterium]|nr:hypothetical protein [Candidatus Binatia bacterium]